MTVIQWELPQDNTNAKSINMLLFRRALESDVSQLNLPHGTKN